MHSLSQCVQEAIKSLMLIHELSADADFGLKEKLLIKFAYDDQLNNYALLMINNEGISMTALSDLDGSSITLEKLVELQVIHDKLFDEDGVIADSWERLYYIFVSPVLDLVSKDFRGYIFAIFDDNCFPDIAFTPFFNLAHIFNLCFLFAETKVYHNRIIFVNVSDDPVKFIRKLSVAQRPLVKDMDIIYGFPKQYDPDTLLADPLNAELQRGKARETAFTQGMAYAKANGAKVHILQDISIFEKVFDKTHQGRVVQLLTHFHGGKIYTPGLKAFVHLNSLANLLDRMFEEDRLRNDIALHAATCNNFSYFQVLVKKGIKNIYYSANDLDLNSIAGRFVELYSGHNANIVGFDYPYLDGSSFIFEAWEKVFRCFCKLNLNYSKY